MESARRRVHRIARAYNAWAADYAKHGEEAARDWFREPQALFAACLPLAGQVLDVGCGPGLEMSDIRPLGLRTVGLDVAGEQLRLARVRLPEVEVAQGTVLALPFAGRAFDGVWASASLHHLTREEVPGALAEIRRVLRPGGALYSSVLRGDRAGWIRGSVVATEIWYTFFRRDEWRTLLESAGFSITWFLESSDVENANEGATGWLNSLAVTPLPARLGPEVSTDGPGLR